MIVMILFHLFGTVFDTYIEPLISNSKGEKNKKKFWFVHAWVHHFEILYTLKVPLIFSGMHTPTVLLIYIHTLLYSYCDLWLLLCVWQSSSWPSRQEYGSRSDSCAVVCYSSIVADLVRFSHFMILVERT